MMELAGVPFQNPLRYTGPQANLIPILVFHREPTTTDVKYRIGQVALIGKNPTSGTQGDLWYLANFNSSGVPQWLQLLTGAGIPGVDSITTDDGAPAVDPDGNGNINILSGTGITVTGQGPGNTVTISSTGRGLLWEVITAATKTIVVEHGYFANRGAGVTFTLPATASVGDTFIISAINAGGWTIAQNASQTIKMGNQDTAAGVGGSLASTDDGDTVEIVCSIENTNFVVLSSMGNITVT